MLEWLITIGATELGKAVLEQGLKLTQAAAEDYVKDFFKGCLKDGITVAKPEVAKKAVAAALQGFLLIVTEELEDHDLSKAEIRDRYDAALVQFVKNGAVKPLLGSAFEKDCRAIDTDTLAATWQKSQFKNKPFPALPEGFDWQQVGSLYLKKVRRIVRETPELRSLLETELLEEIARNTTQISPGFDVAQYRHSLQCSYGYLKLFAIDSTDDLNRAIKLWNIFIEQTVRESLPPIRHELPLDLKRQFQAQGQLETDLSAAALEQYRSEYLQQPLRKVLEAIEPIRSPLAPLKKGGTGTQGAVILGDPGAGKSTLLQYLALEWAEGKSAVLPLLIELREYVLAGLPSFLDFLHRGRGADWQFDPQQLHQHLQSQPTLVMFDGLDEVFDRATQSAIVDDMIRFAQQYPQAQILITSRIIGYNPDRLQQANFRHFTIQPLDTAEIHEFIDRWYTLALGNDSDKPRLVTRLKEAIANSKAIQNLADNPLLLTMMAILNRRQELPRDRADLYDQASRVLLYHWDVDHKKLNLPLDTIGRREKQEMLRLVAYEMQTSEEGLKGNLISADRLTRILTDYLRNQGFGEPREKANGLIDQLRHRNWILCDRGADTYGFVHRTFLEYFCAMEIVHRFEKQHTLTFEQLRDQVFGLHWQDETWHEVLRLICGAIETQISGKILEELVRQYEQGTNILSLKLASLCLLEIKNRHRIKAIDEKLMNLLMLSFNSWKSFSTDTSEEENREIYEQICNLIGRCWGYSSVLLEWLNSIISSSENSLSKFIALRDLGASWKDIGEVSIWIKSLAKNSADISIQKASVLALTYPDGGDRDDLELFALLKTLYQQDIEAVSQAAIFGIFRTWRNLPETASILKECLVHKDPYMRWPAVQALARDWKDDPDTLSTLTKYLHDESDMVRCHTLKFLVANQIWRDSPEVAEIIFQLAGSDPLTSSDPCKLENKRDWKDSSHFTALKAVTTHYPTHPKTLELLRDRATNDPDEQLRQWAQEQIKAIEEK